MEKDPSRYFYFNIEMLDHDFKDYDTIIDEFFTKKHLYMNLYEYSERQFVNINMFFLKAFYNKKINPPNEIIENLLRYKCKQIYFVLAGYLSIFPERLQEAKNYWLEYETSPEIYNWISNKYCTDQNLIKKIKAKLF